MPTVCRRLFMAPRATQVHEAFGQRGSALSFHVNQTRSRPASEHEGVFALAPEHVSFYFEQYQPVCLRQLVTTPVPEDVTASNFGISKGLTHDRVLIFPTDPIRAFLTKGDVARRQVSLRALRRGHPCSSQRCLRHAKARSKPPNGVEADFLNRPRLGQQNSEQRS